MSSTVCRDSDSCVYQYREELNSLITHIKHTQTWTFDLLSAIKICILPIRYESIQTCDEHKIDVYIMGGGGAFSKRTWFMGRGVQAIVTKRNNGVGRGFQKYTTML